MKVEKRKQIIKLAIVVVVVVVLGFLSQSLLGYLPVIGNLIAEKKLSNYASIQKGSPEKIETKYDWYNTEYQSVKGDFIYSLQRNTVCDRKVSDQIDSNALNQYDIVKSQFPQNLSFPSRNTIWTEFDEDDYSLKSQRLHNLAVYNTEDISVEESEKMCAVIGDKFINLMGEDYNFTGIQIFYYDKNGAYESTINPNGFKRLEYDEILSKTKKVDRLSEDYLDWLSKQKSIKT